MKTVIRDIIYSCGLQKMYNFLAIIKSGIIIKINRCKWYQRYFDVIKRIHTYSDGRKIRVAFLCGYCEKWKAQSLYKTFERSRKFKPLIVVSAESEELKFDAQGAIRRLMSDIEFYRNLGDECVLAIDPVTCERIPLQKFNPDIVFYQTPGMNVGEHRIELVSNFALCCYIPYSIETFNLSWIHRIKDFHGKMFVEFVPSKSDEIYIKKQTHYTERPFNLLGSGHTVFDNYLDLSQEYQEYKEIIDNGYTIYAPHFSFPIKSFERPIIISTFMDNGYKILEYAKQHPEFNWLFKPHPSLRMALERDGGWTRQAIDAYYHEWEKIGAVSYDSSYINYFIKSRALITDCSSFLVEYPITRRPIIRLIQKKSNVVARPHYDKMFSTFYNVHNDDEMYNVFRLILEENKDPKCSERLQAVKNAGMMAQNVADTILDYFNRICHC